MKFEQMNLIRPILRAIREVGYTEPTPIQQKTVPPVLQGKDVLGCAQTGTGKTAAFALPILQRVARAEDFDEDAPRPIRALILTPTRELALQIYDNFTQYGKYLPVRCAVIFGGVNQNPQVEQLRAGVDILVATPGRLNDLIGQGHISLRDIRIFVLDEADRMLDMGFIHDVRKVMAKLPDARQTLLFSATMPPQVEEIAAQLLTNPVNVKISPVTGTVDSVEQSVYFLTKTDKIKLLLHLLNGNGVASALVFTRTKHGADQVARLLNKNNVKALAIHGNKSQNARQTALSRFKAGEIDVLVATDIAARGIDIVELPTVINYNVPEEPETYIHRIGRTGRAGMEGVAITFCCSDELESFHDIEKLIRKTVTERQCEWSVADMQPTKPEPKQQNPRGSRGQRTAEQKPLEQGASRTKSAQNQNKPQKGEKVSAQKPEREGKQGERPSKQGNQPKQNNTSAQKPEREGKQGERQTKQGNQPKQNNTSTQKPEREEKQGERPSKQGNQPKQNNTSTKKTEKSTTSKPHGTQQKNAQPKKVAAKSDDSKRETVTTSRPTADKGGQARRFTSADAVHRSQEDREKVKSAPSGGDRRYADSGEHDGATGQQIVTNFNRSVWLEFNEPPKRSKKPWLIGTDKSAQAKPTETKAPQSAGVEPITQETVPVREESESKRSRLFSRLRRGKKQQ